ncbi:hypothetical protein NECID01_1371 [Nematocida sp. AWRm77]|nr:hypothetical protein NECID01_1371 [Nematocida sp. AWRm77]
MSIVYIPLVEKEKEVCLEESLPSPLCGKVTSEEWEKTMHRLNFLLLKRKLSLSTRLLSILFFGSLLKRYFLSQIDKEIEEYLEKKNLVLQRVGVYIHHPKERRYSGLDVSIYTYI